MIAENNLGYDKTNPASIELYSQNLIDKTFREIYNEDDGEYLKKHHDFGTSNVSSAKRNKGNLGQILEERFFHYKCNSDSCPDFPEAGVELKVTPYRRNKNGSLSAKERLILTMIDYFDVVSETFENSHLWYKSKLILLVYYLYLKEVPDKLDYKIHYSKLFTPSEQDLKIIREDFYKIVAKIKAGKAHELSEGDTLYLGAATKASTSKDQKKQPFSKEFAKPRAFAFKSSYMTYVLNNYIVPSKTTYEPIVKETLTGSFEDYVVNSAEKYKGFSIDELCKKFDIDISKGKKNLTSIMAFRMLGVKGNNAEEFIKANIVVKAIRIEKNNRIKESMSFPRFKFKELVHEKWEDSTFGNYLRETRFLFVVYKFDSNNVLRLKGCQFWNIPYADLEGHVKKVWQKTKKVVKEGLKITHINGKWNSNLPRIKEDSVCHVRPHGKNAKDTDELPDGRRYPKQCFWLKNTYIFEQIDDKLKVNQTD